MVGIFFQRSTRCVSAMAGDAEDFCLTCRHELFGVALKYAEAIVGLAMETLILAALHPWDHSL